MSEVVAFRKRRGVELTIVRSERGVVAPDAPPTRRLTMTIPSLGRRLSALAATAAAATLLAFAPAALAKNATIEIEIYKAGFIVGGSGGSGSPAMAALPRANNHGSPKLPRPTIARSAPV